MLFHLSQASVRICGGKSISQRFKWLSLPSLASTDCCWTFFTADTRSSTEWCPSHRPLSFSLCLGSFTFVLTFPLSRRRVSSRPANLGPILIFLSGALWFDNSLLLICTFYFFLKLSFFDNFILLVLCIFCRFNFFTCLYTLVRSKSIRKSNQFLSFLNFTVGISITLLALFASSFFFIIICHPPHHHLFTHTICLPSALILSLCWWRLTSDFFPLKMCLHLSGGNLSLEHVFISF